MASQGRSSAMVCVVLLLVSAAAVVQGATHTVGGASGWRIPGTNGSPSTYLADWAANETFAAGDTVVFVYTAGAHNVLAVTSDAYNACTITSPLNKTESGNDSLILAAGANYYICGFLGHCSGGQKVTITTTTASPGTPPPPAAPGTPAVPAPGSSAAGNSVTLVQVLAAIMVSLVASLALW